jgi:hypothetical protein
MFKVGDQVSWQCRNKYRSNPRAQASFYVYEGEISSIAPLTATFQYAGRDEQGRDVAKTGTQQFRQLKNGKYIPSSEDRDDPKGRLYLKVIPTPEELGYTNTPWETA